MAGEQSAQLPPVSRSSQEGTVGERDLPTPQDILESMAEGFLALDPDGLVTYCNASAERLLGLRRDAVVGLAIARVLPAAEGSGDPYQEALGGALPPRFEAYSGPAPQAQRYQVTLRRSGCGLAVYFASTSERRPQAVQLADYETIADNVGDLIGTVDGDYRYVFANRALLRHYGLPAAEVIRQPVAQVVGEGVFRQVLKPIIDNCLRGEAMGTEIVRDFPGHPRHALHVTGLPVRDASGTVTGATLMARDVTATRALEEERKATVEFLELLNASKSRRELVRDAVDFFKRHSHCQAVGIRLRRGDAFPYFYTSGFGEEFVQEDCRPSAPHAPGGEPEDEAGSQMPHCMCRRVLGGRFDPGMPCFTKQSSFWSSSNTVLPASQGEPGDQPCICDRCRAEGYQSVALIPLRSEGRTLGLLQFCDPHPGKLEEASVATLERLAGSLAVGLARWDAEEQTRSSESKLRRLLDEMVDGAVVTDASGRIVEWNSAAGHITGIGPEQAIGEVIWTVLRRMAPPSERSPERFAAIRDIVQSGEERTLATFPSVRVSEFVIERPDGQRRILQTTAFPMRSVEDPPGEMLYGSLVRDITEQKAAEQALRESERRYRLLFEKSHNCIALLEPILDASGSPYDYRYLDVNPAYERQTGDRRCDVVGRTERELRPGQVPQWLDLIATVALTGEPVHTETYSAFTGHHYEGSCFSPAKGLVAFAFVDVTESRLAEESLRRVSAYNRSLIQASLDPLVVIGPDGRITDVNAATEAITGYSQGELIGTDFSSYFTQPESARAGYQQAFRETLVRDYALEIRHRDGSVTPVLYNASVYR
ncbi:MAG: PAS domain S-box protein, partial [Anaerolineae bacterium]